jgi:transposase-like protein
MKHPCCPTCGSPLRSIELIGPAGLTSMRCTPCGKTWQKPEWR